MSSEGTVEYGDVGPYIIRTQSGNHGIDGPIKEAIEKAREIGEPWGISKPGQGYVLEYSD